MNRLEKQLTELSPAKRAWLELQRRQAESRGIGSTPPPIRRQTTRNSRALSFAQQRLWLIQQLDPNSYLYNVPRAVRILGHLDVVAFERSINTIVERHEVLRTTFPVVGDQPRQVVLPASPLRLEVTDLSSLPTQAQEDRAMQVALEEAHRPFDLATGPVLRCRLLRLSTSDHILVVVMHHIVSDGWTGGVLFNELGQLYSALEAGKESPLPELAIQYADFAEWQREWLQGAALENELSYWRNHLAGAPAQVELPLDHLRPETPSYRGATQRMTLPAEISEALKTLSRRHSSTVFTTLLAGLKILLYRWTGQEDLVVGTISANRNQTAIENLLGCFVNFLPLRDKVTGGESAAEFLAKVNATVLGAHSHQDCPFEKIIEAINPQRVLNLNPLYNVGLQMQNFPQIAFRSDAVEARFLELDTAVAFLDLRFVAVDTRNSLRIDCEFNSDLFEAKTIQQLLESYAEVLGRLVTQPPASIAEFPLSENLAQRAKTARMRRQTLAIASTFTAEPIEVSLQFWMKQLGIQAEIKFAPYNQVFVELLDSSSLLRKNTVGCNVMLLRPEDWQGPGPRRSWADAQAAVEANIDEFIAAVKTTAPYSAVPQLLCVCPVSRRASSEQSAFYRSIESRLVTELSEIAGFHVITAGQLLTSYPVPVYDEDYADELGHIPYTPELFLALGSMVARRVQGILCAARQVIVASGDILGSEDFGGNDDSRRALEEFLLQQYQAGMLLCLSGKNSEISQSRKRLLTSEHIVAMRNGDQPQSRNLRELAEELQVGFDEIIYIDPNPAACAEVRANCPEVLTLQLPETPQRVVPFLRNVWALDHWPDSGALPSGKLRVTPTPETIERIALTLATVDEISAAIGQQDLRPRTKGPFLAPSTPTEEIVAGIWSYLLHVDPIGRKDNFFELGGHSLLAMQVVARLRRTMQAELPLRALFEAQTLAEFAAFVDKQRGSGVNTSTTPLLPSLRRTEQPAPLSSAQQRLWFLEQLEGPSSLYNVPQVFRIKGKLNVAALEKSIQEIVRRHDSLRTSIGLRGDQPVQIVAEQLTIAFPVVDVRHLASDQRQAELQRLIREEAHRPFNLSKAPMLRTLLVRVHDDEYAFLINSHHLASDRWSMGLMSEELAALYSAFSQGKPSPLPELPVQYSDYALWQRQWLASEEAEKHLSYWQDRLAGAPPVLELPMDRPRPAVQSTRGATTTHLLPKELVGKLVCLSRAEGVTLFMTLLAAFQTLLSRYSGQEDVIVGSPIANRTRTEVERLIGCFVNTLALRTDLSDNPTFRELLSRVREVSLGAYAHQDLPFEKLVEKLQPERSLAHNPIFQVLFALQNAPMRPLELPELELTRVPFYTDTAMFDMSWFVIEVPDGLLVRAEYSTDMFEEATIARALGHFEKLLDAVVERPDERLLQIPLLSESERQQLLIEFNDTKSESPQASCVHQFFEAQTERTPDRVAVVCDQQQLSYEELNSRANRLAHFLRKQGVGPEVLVAICVERSEDMLVGLLAILKAGGAYVPLDPTYPKERLRCILEDAKVALLLTQHKLLSDLPAHEARHVCLDADWPEISREPSRNPEIAIGRQNLAYVLFTSGSTGRAKGVALEHRSATTFLDWARRVFTREELSGVLFSTSVCFDLSVFEVFAPLSVGGKVIIAQNALYLPFLHARNDVTLINTVPSAMAELLRINGVPRSVKTVNLAGEALSDTLVEQIYRSTSVDKVYNLYGPTEDTTYSTFALVPRGARVTIGRPVANTQAYVLDAGHNPVPIGVAGELYLAGAGLARGYFGRPDLTAERFIDNPFSSQPGERMYRTGDLCRWLPDRRLQYLGRIDNQVKLRGFRIELAEIENSLAKHASIRQSLVVAREDELGMTALVAYVVLVDGHQASDDNLRDHLKQSLPEFMIPSAFVVLDSIPLTPNGKINRKALPAPECKTSTGDYIGPRTATEEVVAAIWAKLLHLDQVGVHDDFFSLGGHSLLATRVISRIRQSLGTDLPLRALFEGPTVAELAALVDKSSRARVAPPLVPVARDQEFQLSFAQQRLWFLYQLEPGSPFYNIPQGLRVRGTLDVAALEKSLNEIVRRHEVLRTTYSMRRGHPVQLIAPHQQLRLSQTSLEPLPVSQRKDAAQRFIAEEARRPFDLEKGPVIRANLLRLSLEEHILVLNTHHIASDGWSMGLFVHELTELYSAFVQRKPSPLPELATQYADFAVWQREWIRDEVLENHLSYWRKQLENAPTAMELPTDRRRPAVPSFKGAIVEAVFPNELKESLKKLSRREGSTLYMTLLAAFQSLLFRYTGQEDVVVGSPIANRNYGEIENLIGFFVNALTMRTKLTGNPTFRELMGRVRDVALQAYAHQDLPFEKLVEEFDPERGRGYNPLFQVLFVLQNAPKYALELPGLNLEWLPIYNGTAKFDIALHIAERPEGLSSMMEFNTDLFDSSTISRMLGHWRVLLESVAADADQRIAALPILTAEERKNLLVDFNQRGISLAADRCIHQWVEAQVERTPNSVALVFEGQTLTYAELNQRANQLAHYLRKRGVGPEVLVGMCMDRSLEMVVGIVGILKAGGAYLPLDLAYPLERIGFILADAKPPVVLTQQTLKDKLPAEGAQVICLDTDWTAIAQESASNPVNGTAPENLAYVIYTSGSTGQPKGCLVTHYNVVRLFQATWNWYKFDEHDVWTMFHSYAFDFSVWEIWGALFYGGKVVVVPSFVSRSPEDFYRLLHKERVTVLNQTPSSFRQLIQAEESVGRQELALRYVIFGGEALDMQSLTPWYQRHGDNTPLLVNMYGITETTVHATYRPLSVCDTASGSVIGKPIPDLQLYILDQQRQPMPIGVPGEMYVGGAGVARGYLNRPELTNERFIPDSFSSRLSARLYKTGDRARFLPDGDIEYLGRIDHQVKIRGFRIELGEIESVLATHPGVRQSVVIAREDEPGSKQLVAYVVPDKQAQLAQEKGSEWQQQQVSQWETTFDETYEHTADEVDTTFNITGWNSSYTGQPIPAEHMREWVDSTVNRIQAFAPTRVLEIGCGTGLLLLRIAPGCEKYVGTDFSEKVIARLEKTKRERGLGRVSLEKRMADDFSGIAPGEFDTVILNSVAQYFPSIEYLVRVLEGAMKAVAPGGRIFIGDNRSLPLLEAFHTAVQLYQSSDSLPTSQLLQRIQRRLPQDEELVIDPGFFHALKAQLADIGRVEVQVKRGRFHNEMSEFRYDAVLHIGNDNHQVTDCNWLNWERDKLSVTALRNTLADSSQRTLGITGIPNARVAAAVDAWKLLRQQEVPETVGELRSAVEGMSVRDAVEPEDIWAIAHEFGYDAKISWPTDLCDGCMNVVFRRNGRQGSEEPDWAVPAAPNEPKTFKPAVGYANRPISVAIKRNLVPQLRRLAGSKLPEYMVPSSFVVLDKLPLTENGKVDRRALPAPDQSRPETRDYVGARNVIEETLASIWADVLRIERAGAQDNFFELGGHSLSATRVVARLRQAFAVELPLRALFETPTIEALARTIEKLKRSEHGAEAPPIVPVNRGQLLPLSLAQQRLWFLDQLDPGSWLYNIPRAIRLTGKLNADAMKQALNGLIARHEILRTTYQVRNDQAVQVIAPELIIELPLLDLSSLPASSREAEAGRVVQEEAAKGFDLSRDSILRGLVIKLAQQDHILFLNTHHIASDGWSSAVMLNDLSALYQAALEKKPATLPPLEVQYADYAVWQRNRLKGEVLEKQLAYWKANLEGAPPILSLPSDRPRPAARSFRGVLYESAVPRSLTDALQALGRQQGATLFMTMLAGFEALIHYYTSQHDIVLGTDLANRTSVQTEALIGFFVNLLPLRTDVSGDPTFEELIHRVRDVSLEAYTHQDLPFDKLVEELRPERNLMHSPIVQVLFVQQNTPPSSAGMPGLEMGRFPLEVPSKFDLAVFINERRSEIVGAWVYSPDLFDANTIAQMAANFQTLLQAAVSDPGLRLESLGEFLTRVEKQKRGREHEKFQQAGLEKLRQVCRKREPAQR